MPSGGYTQIFRDGRIEAVSCNIVSQGNGNLILSAPYIEEIILEGSQRMVTGLRSLGIPQPFVVMAGLNGVKGAVIQTDRGLRSRVIKIDRPRLILPEVWIEDDDFDLSAKMEQTFNALWNAGGHTGSPRYGPGRT
jgi:hypothetical protein